MLGISDAAESIGFRTRGYRLTWEQLRDQVSLLKHEAWFCFFAIMLFLVFILRFVI